MCQISKRKNFTTIEQTFITLFWSLFGLSDYRGVELAQYPLSRIIGYLLYGAYSLITVVIMLNMLIGKKERLEKLCNIFS